MGFTATRTYFRLWSPKARSVRVNLYTSGDGDERVTTTGGNPLTLCLMPDGRGLWSASTDVDLRGKFYTFSVVDDKGNEQAETPGIFAQAVGVNGRRAQIIDLRTTDPDGWHQDAPPTLDGYNQAIVYEMHHRDFSIDRRSGITHRGKFLALTERGTTTTTGEKTGIDHLADLGVTHVHLLPSFDFGSIDESRPDRRKYNWGYDPVNYNVPEGSYATNPYAPEVRIREFKQMVMSLHQTGLRVVMDVVYNHVHDLASSPFERTAPAYFFRRSAEGIPANGSGCGNETASERPMMRKYMIESILYWVKEYHIDGFRFDLMGLHDIPTMNAIRQAVDAIDPTILIYGEGWAAATPSLDNSLLATKANTYRMPRIAVFGDEMRDALRGPWDKDTKGAFLAGIPGHEESVKFGIAGAFTTGVQGINMAQVNYSHTPWATTPTQMISYVSCHDDLCLADRIKATIPKANEAELSRLQKLAYTAVLTSRGIPFIWCGDEVMRTRKGIRNCYKSPDAVNAIKWTLKTTHRDVYDYIRSLIRWRRRSMFHTGALEFLPTTTSNVIAYRYSCPTRQYVVILNANRKAIIQRIPQGKWIVLCRGEVFHDEGIAQLRGKSIRVPAQSVAILSCK